MRLTSITIGMTLLSLPASGCLQRALPSDEDASGQIVLGNSTQPSIDVRFQYPEGDEALYSDSKTTITFNSVAVGGIHGVDFQLFIAENGVVDCDGLTASNEYWELVTRFSSPPQSFEFDFSTYPSGVYYFCLSAPDGDFWTISGSARVSHPGEPLAPTNLTGGATSA